MGKILIILIGVILIVVNILSGLIFNDYHAFNVAITSTVIFINSVLLLVVSWSEMSDAYKVSLSVLIPTICLIECILAILSPDTFDDNYYVTGIMGLLALELILLLFAFFITKLNEER